VDTLSGVGLGGADLGFRAVEAVSGMSVFISIYQFLLFVNNVFGYNILRITISNLSQEQKNIL